MTTFAPRIDETHDPKLRSWVESANDPANEFPIQNLPLCVFAHGEGERHLRQSTAGVVIGDRVIDLRLLHEARLLDDLPGVTEHEAGTALGLWDLGGVLAASVGFRRALRARLVSLLRQDNHALRDNPQLINAAVFFQRDVVPGLPLAIGDYTDFYASMHHAWTVGSMFRPDNPLLPNYKYVPIGYHGRGSSIVPSGRAVHRPSGQQPPPDTDPKAPPTFGPCKMLDYELEVACFIAGSNDLGVPTPIEHARERIAGLCLLNDWSARDIQKWEYQPLGPFLAKNFASTVSPFIVTAEALEPFRCGAYVRPPGDPSPLPYLRTEEDQALGGYDITLEVFLQSAEMENRGIAPVRISKSRAFKDMYWTFSQMIAHHTSGGCNLRPGDLLGSGTVSGTGPAERGCLLELTWDGAGNPRKPLALPGGETRIFLADGDTVTLRGYCERPGFRRIGFGECRGTIVAGG